jgi:glycosyltransferase involved in cell wall biosynthesis
MVATIPHGVDDSIRLAPRTQLPLSQYSTERPFKFLYVSSVDLYKFQWTLAAAASQARARGFPIALDLIGPAYGPAMRKLEEIQRRMDPNGECVRYLGPATGEELVRAHHEADAFAFASTCENMPNILLAAMAAGLPIACSDRGPMPEITGDDAIYFDPENIDSIAGALETLSSDAPLRTRLAAGAYSRAMQFSWELCCRQTFAFLRAVRDAHGRKTLGAPA